MTALFICCGDHALHVSDIFGLLRMRISVPPSQNVIAIHIHISDMIVHNTYQNWARKDREKNERSCNRLGRVSWALREPGKYNAHTSAIHLIPYICFSLATELRYLLPGLLWH